ncbi:MAG: hypothetical protein V2J55_10755 [Candidatus Competibacteraceae bacterium]|jgi:hypothetical protein|nr:hypothetical protein [Candidatus Competibacteraceae bacterium]
MIESFYHPDITWRNKIYDTVERDPRPLEKKLRGRTNNLGKVKIRVAVTAMVLASSITLGSAEASVPPTEQLGDSQLQHEDADILKEAERQWAMLTEYGKSVGVDMDALLDAASQVCSVEHAHASKEELQLIVDDEMEYPHDDNG